MLEGNIGKVFNDLISVILVHWLKMGGGEWGTQQALEVFCWLYRPSWKTPIVDTTKFAKTFIII